MNAEKLRLMSKCVCSEGKHSDAAALLTLDPTGCQITIFKGHRPYTQENIEPNASILAYLKLTGEDECWYCLECRNLV